MVRWRACLMLAVLLLLPRIGGNMDEDEDDDRNEEADDDDNDNDDDEPEPAPARSRAPAPTPSPKTPPLLRSDKKLPLDCYVCAFKSETPLRSCLDPSKYRVHSITCQNVDDKCFTSVITKDKSYEAIVRGCRSNCIGSIDTMCCEVNRCNNQAFAMPLVPRSLEETPVADTNKATKAHPSSVVFFVTILLALQTVVKVSFV